MTLFQKGAIAPLAMLFTILSMLMTVAYLQNTTSISAMERYRYAEAKAIYLAEAGLNEVGVVVLSTVSRSAQRGYRLTCNIIRAPTGPIHPPLHPSIHPNYTII